VAALAGPDEVDWVGKPGRQDPERIKAGRLANRARDQVRRARDPQDRDRTRGEILQVQLFQAGEPIE